MADTDNKPIVWVEDSDYVILDKLQSGPMFIRLAKDKPCEADVIIFADETGVETNSCWYAPLGYTAERRIASVSNRWREHLAKVVAAEYGGGSRD